MRYWAFLSIPLSIAAGFSCDKLWSSSVVDCGRPGFPCPAGYSPDMPITDSDGGSSVPDGGGSDQGGPGAGDMATGIPAGYTSVYTLTDLPRTTLVGTSDGRVRIYAYSGAVSTFALSTQFTEESGVPIVGLWRGSLYGSGTPNNFTIVAPNTNKIYTHLNNATGISKTTPQVINAMWVSRRNDNSNGPIYSNAQLYLAANNGKIIEADVLQSPTLSISAFNEISLGVSSSINSVAGLQFPGSSGGISRACAPPCDVMWAAGDAGKLFGRDETSWHPITLASGTLGQTARILGIASSRDGSSETPPAVAVGKDGLYVERPSGDASQWQTLLTPPFATTTMNAVCYFDNHEAWVVGEGGVVYQYQVYPGPPAWAKVTLPSLGKDLSKVSFRAVHCAEAVPDATTPRNRRVTIVGSNNTLIFADDVSNMGAGYTWTLVE
jgi:hypothetical protein